MKAALAVILAVLGVAMFSASLWLQGSGLPETADGHEQGGALAGELPRALEPQGGETVALDPELPEKAVAEPVAAGAKADWAVDHVLLK